MPHDRTPTSSYTIGELARAVGVNVETIRFYQRKGLMPQPDRPYGSIRRYAAADLDRLRFIRSAQKLGFSLDEVAELLRLQDGTSCAEARLLGKGKLMEVRRKLQDLRDIELALSRLIAQCGTARGQVRCPLIEAMHGDAGC